MEKGSNPDLLRARSIAYEDGHRSTAGWPCCSPARAASTWTWASISRGPTPSSKATYAEEADRVLGCLLWARASRTSSGVPDGEDKAEKSDLLRQTEYSQPATLTMDVAILRLLAAYGVLPDLVAGHSLGEYGAAVAAGVMTFEQSLCSR